MSTEARFPYESVTQSPIMEMIAFPDGWQSEITYQDSHHFSVFDEHGRERIWISLLDVETGRLEFRPLTRYFISPVNGDGVIRHVIRDRGKGGKVIFKSNIIAYDFTLDSEEIARVGANDECIDWLNEHFPDYKDPEAYWDDDESSATHQTVN